MPQLLLKNRIREVPDKVANWLLHSPIVIRDSSHMDYGGVFAWLTDNTADSSFIYSEITGYYLTWLCYKANIKSTDKLRKQIKGTADWLINRALNDEKTGFWYRKYANEQDFRRSVYWFDNCMAINGLIHAYTLLGDLRYLHISREILQLLMNDIHAMAYTIPWNGNLVGSSNMELWSEHNGPFLLKCLLPLIHLSQVTNQPHYLEIIHTCFEKYASLQKREGNFVSNIHNNTFLHPHLYTLEAYWAYGVVAYNDTCIQIAKRGIDWILNRFNTEGYSGYMDSEGKPLLNGIGSDALAQTIRLMTLMSYPDQDTFPLVTMLMEHYFSESTSGKGCFKYGYIIENKWKNDQNCWSSMFAYQALDLYNNDASRKLLLRNPTFLI